MQKKWSVKIPIIKKRIKQGVSRKDIWRELNLDCSYRMFLTLLDKIDIPGPSEKYGRSGDCDDCGREGKLYRSGGKTICAKCLNPDYEPSYFIRHDSGLSEF